MNLILVDQQDFITADTVVIYGRYIEHILQAHDMQEYPLGDQFPLNLTIGQWVPFIR
ncbi:MAG: hypothetical protein V7784_16780 [Oceanospirillaceae bacterium]